MNEPLRAVGIVSGGLDSLLAVRVMLNLGAHVTAVFFKTALWEKDAAIPVPEEQRSRFELRAEDITNEFLEMLRYPRYGRGTAFNPCIDCKAFMLSKAREIMQDAGADVVFTGEVIGQRPMSQTRDAMRIIERESGLEGRLLRPLCARHFPPTIPEQEGRIEREGFLDFQGRSRRPQIELAEDLGIENIPGSAGGCILTDKNYGTRMFDLLTHGQYDLNNILLCKVGRHFRLSDSTKAVVGRDRHENRRIASLARSKDCLLEPAEAMGATSLLRGQMDEEHVRQAAALTHRYSDARNETGAKFRVTQPGGASWIMGFEALQIEEVMRKRI